MAFRRAPEPFHRGPRPRSASPSSIIRDSARSCVVRVGGVCDGRECFRVTAPSASSDWEESRERD